MSSSLITLHARGAKLLSREENGMVVILGVPCVLFLLQEGPATHILQTLRRVPQFNQTHGLEKAETEKQLGEKGLRMIQRETKAASCFSPGMTIIYSKL